MKLRVNIGAKEFCFDSSEPVGISIPLIFNGPQPNHFGVDPAKARALEAGDFIGDTRRGGDCNVEICQLIPHCNGTHTECVGHITDERISVHRVLKACLIPATLITVVPEPARSCPDVYQPEKHREDLLITASAVANCLRNAAPEFLQGLIIRTLPNDASKTSRKYLENPPPYLSLNAMELIAELEVQHLLVDIPSVDRMFDEGQLNAHRIFWNIPAGVRLINKNTRVGKTITEMVFIPDNVADGRYLANIQIPEFVSDAAPSRVQLFKLREMSVSK